MSGNGRSGLGHVAGDMNHGVLNSTGNSSGLSVGASSLVTDANSAISGGPQLQRSASINNESYLRLPASPMSFSSNNISGSSMMEGSSIVQPSPHQEHVQKQGASSATSQLSSQEPGNLLNAQKKPRLEIRQEDILQQQMIQQLLQRHNSVQPHGHQNLQLQAMLQQQRLMQRQQQQQQIIQSFPNMQLTPITLQHQQLRQQLQQQAVQLGTPVKRPFDSGICSRRLMQYLYHQRHRPQDNSVQYWRKFVTEYFAPRSKKRLCLSMYDSISNHALGVFPQSATDTWQCDLCGSKSGKGFEASFEVLPRLCQIKFDRGIVDENLFLDMPHECRLSSGVMVLEYAKAVQESVFENLRVVREGQLRIIFTPELKIISWEFCARRHEEFLPRRLLASQVNQLLQVAQKYQTATSENGSSGVSHQDLQASCNMFVTAGRLLAKNMELQTLNDMGFSKRYVRCLQISEVVNSMKDLIDFSQEHKIGPIESLKNYTRQAASKMQKQKLESEQLVSAHGLPADQSTLNKSLSIQPGLGNNVNNTLSPGRVLGNNMLNDAALNNYQNILKSSLNPAHNVLQQELSNSINGPKHAPPMHFPGTTSSILPNQSGSGLPGQHQQQPQLSGCLPQQNNLQSFQMNQHLQQRAIQQMLQDMLNNDRGGAESQNASNISGNMAASQVVRGGSAGAAARMGGGSVTHGPELQNMPINMSNNPMVAVPSRSNSFKSPSNPTFSGNSLNSRPDLPQNMDLPELDHFAQDFVDNVMFDGDGW